MDLIVKMLFYCRMTGRNMNLTRVARFIFMQPQRNPSDSNPVKLTAGPQH